jgi:di/tricarboxylate transporter
MTIEIAVVLMIVVVAMLLTITERMPGDLVALFVLVTLAVSGILTPVEALAGFSNPAVVTIWAIFFLSTGLFKAGVANIIGAQVLRVASGGEMRIIGVTMLTAAALSAFLSNIGVAALMLPVVMDVARRTGISPSRLLMPLVFAVHLGGMTTLIGTQPNIIASDALRTAGLEPFHIFDFTAAGVVLMVVGLLFMLLAGRHLLPRRNLTAESASMDRRSTYELRERMFLIPLPADSILVGRSIAETRLVSSIGLQILAIFRRRKTVLAPGRDTILRRDDQLLVAGRVDRLEELRLWGDLTVSSDPHAFEHLTTGGNELVEAVVTGGGELIGVTLTDADFLGRFGLFALALRRGETTFHAHIHRMPLEKDDRILFCGGRDRVEMLQQEDLLQLRHPSPEEIVEAYQIDHAVFFVPIDTVSPLIGRPLSASYLSDVFDLRVLAILRNSQMIADGAEQIRSGDELIVIGRPEELVTLRGLQKLEIDRQPAPDLDKLESADVGVVEAMLSPDTQFSGKSLRDIQFRDKYGLSVLAIWREGRAYRSYLPEMALKLGDAMLLYGPRMKIKLLARDPNFLVLTQGVDDVPEKKKAPVAVAIMVAVLIPVIAGWLPLAIAMVTGAALMVLARCLTMEDAYRRVQWRAVFLIAGMLPLATAMQKTGAATLVARGFVDLIGDLGPMAALAGISLLTVLAVQFITPPALVVLVAPIAIATATKLGVSPHTFMIAVALSSSANFISPISHPANVMAMGPGGYRFADFARVGVPLTLLFVVILIVLVPILWPFR